MQKTFSFIFLITLLCSFTLLKTDKPKDTYLGIWTEHWGTDSAETTTDVDYVDTLQFELNSKGKLTISCINNSDYKYSKIKPNESRLNFVMENTVDPKERFIIKYNLQIVNENLIKGTILNSRGKTVPITLKRYK